MKRLAILAASFALHAPLNAQSAVDGNQTSDQPLFTTWSESLPLPRKIWVVTASQPTKRQACRDPQVTGDSLSCKRHFDKTQLFHRNDVVALLNPAITDKRAFIIGAGIFLGLGGGTIYGGVLLAGATLAGGIPVIVLGCVLALTAVGLGIGSGNGDIPERLLYQQPGMPLTVRLGY